VSDVVPLAYRVPPAPIAALIDAPELPDVALSPDRHWLLLLERPALPPIAELAEPELRLAGLRLNPRTNGPSRSSPYRSLALLPLPAGSGLAPEDGQRADAPAAPRPVRGVPDGAGITGPRWSPDGAWIAFSVVGETGLALWVAEVASGAARPLTGPHLNAAYGTPYHWSPDSRSLICKVIPPGREPAPAAPHVPAGPVVQETGPEPAAAWTFQDLLRNPYDADCFEHYLSAEVARIGLDGAAQRLGGPALIASVRPSPDGAYLLVESLRRPFSYLVPAHRFPMRVEVWDADGAPAYLVADLPLAEDVPPVRGAVRTGRRGAGWRADAPATLVWTEAQDGGDPRTAADVRDRVSLLPAPFTGAPTELAALALRFGGVSWGDGDLALVDEWWWQTRRRRTWRVAPARPADERRLLFDRSFEDRYADPGSPLLRRTPEGTYVLLTSPDGKSLYLSGAGASPEGDLPFLDRLDLESGQSERLWRCAAPYYEYAIDFVDPREGRLLTRREAAAEPPNYYIRRLDPDGAAGAAGAAPPVPLTAFPHPVPELAGVQGELLRYNRADGVPLSGMLYLPPSYREEQGRLPLLLWAYPNEFKSAGAAGQVRTSPHRFVRPSPGSPLFFLAAGYAVLDGPAMPIVGEGEAEPNDTYVEQLVADARAAVEAAAARGVADPERVAVGGHSYGAFMTVNLLAHSDLFRAGIARSGAYNRTLTPFGFQAEDRTLWEAPQVYLAMSPYLRADHIKAPLLLIHGEADNNAGTYPMQSERLFDALKGLGATARLVLLPHESHGYRARESVLHTLWESLTWLERYLGPGARA
jgi:dipeptidyl aminopeptidase/acylaminoacyl peptidase